MDATLWWHFGVRAKFSLALAVAATWVGLSIWLSLPWLRDLSALTSPVFAMTAIVFIAYIPGFMNAFLLSTLISDRRPPRQLPPSFPPVTVLVAVYQEETTVADTLKSLAGQDYSGPLEILILNDGSADATSTVAHRAIEMHPFPHNCSARVVDYPHNRGKAAVLNAGLALSRHDLIITIDGDTWVKQDGITQIVERFLSDPPNTRAVAGAILVRNSRDNLLTAAQEWDFFHGIAAVKRMQSMYHGTLVAQGAFSIYTKEVLNEVGGWPATVGEDIVVSWAILANGYRIGYAEDALAFTTVPTTFRQFARQRMRWSRGLMEAFARHGGLLFKPRLTALFIWWNIFLVPMDVVITFVFLPGLVFAALGHFWIAGPLTLALLPLAALWNAVIFSIQVRMFHHEGLKVRHNYKGFAFYALVYTWIMQPICVWGYVSELLGLRKIWGTK